MKTACNHKLSKEIILAEASDDSDEALDALWRWRDQHSAELSNLHLTPMYATDTGGWAITVCPDCC